jgi:hypothetical protein
VRFVVQTGYIVHDMAKEKSKSKRSRGQIETLPFGSLRVSLYAGTDPVTKDRMYLREAVPAGPNAEAEGGRILAPFVSAWAARTQGKLADRVVVDLRYGVALAEVFTGREFGRS